MNGSKPMRPPVKWLLPPLLMGVPAIGDEQLPTLELIEFLGAWETDRGNWVDPFELPEQAEGGDDTRNEGDEQTRDD